MRFAIFSDVHGNGEALSAVLETFENLSVDGLVCLGDTVGYGAEPQVCLDLVTAQANPVLAGNHDWAAAGLEDPRFFNAAALAAIRWTQDALDEEALSTLRDLPLTQEVSGALMVHSSPESPESWHYLFTTGEGRSALTATESPLTFVGHSHVAFICSESDTIRVSLEGEARLDENDRYLINVGSVGQPRDGDPRAAFAVWDTDEGHVALHRVDYDVQTAQDKIRAAGLPVILADRLAYGG